MPPPPKATIPMGVGLYITAGYWFTSSTSFANPAVTVGRAFTDTFASIAAPSIGPYFAGQARLPDGYRRIFRSYVFGPLGLLDYGSASLRSKT